MGEWQYAAGETGENLSLKSVSESAIVKAKKKIAFRDTLSEVNADDIKDIEHYISLLESIHLKKYSDLASSLRYFFCQSIQENLRFKKVPIEPTLTMALLELHKAIEKEEEFAGAISLNYENLLDRAYQQVFKGVNYGVRCQCGDSGYTIKIKLPPLLKLHGSFNWKRGPRTIILDEKQAKSVKNQEMMWIPPGVQKERDTYPFNLLWGKAFELLDCDILRVIGCKLSQNDWGVISLLFNTQLAAARKKEAYKIQLICPHDTGVEIRERNGFLKNVYALGELDNCQDSIDNPPTNAFEFWLRSQLSLHTERGIQFEDLNLRHINRVTGVEK
jgi:hypothetical protein